MEIKTATVDELEARKAAIVEETEKEDADLDALEEELRGINAELEARKKAAEQRAKIRDAVAAGAGTVKENLKEERGKMSDMEIRNSKAYIDAYAEYVKTGKDEEVRALLTENVSAGTVPVPDFVYDVVKTAWDKEGIMARVRKSYLKGNLKVGFEIEGDDAAIHTEGSGAVNEENLVLGVVDLVPETIKKWVSVSDEVMDMRGESFLRYIYEEVTYRIAKKSADRLIAKIVSAGTASTNTPSGAVGLPKLTQASIALGNVAAAIGNLSDEAANPIIVMNKLTWSAFKAAQYAASYAVDPFEGLPIEFNNSLKAFSAASTGDCYMIVGDFDQGALANFPNGDDITFKFDDVTLATSDLVKIIGRRPVALGVVGPNSFVRCVK